MKRFVDRHEAGKLLAEELKNYTKNQNVIILALPRGGVPVAYEIATALSVPLDIFVVRKLGVPGHEELAMGAIATGDVTVFNNDILHTMAISQNSIESVIGMEKKELARREKAYRGNRPPLTLSGKIIILVDDGIATGATMRAAIKALRQQHPSNIIVAVPVAARETYDEIKTWVDKMICLLKPENFYAVGVWYENFPQTSDEEVFELLKK